MKKIIVISIFILTVLACNTVKKTQESINHGNYDRAIVNAVKQLRKNKTKKSNQSYVLMLEEAYSKVTKRDLEKIAFYEKAGNPANLEVLFNEYLKLDDRQNLIKPLLPLPIIKKGRDAKFQFKNYSQEIISTTKKLSEYLYINAQISLVKSINKLEFRSTYDDLKYIQDINPNYKNTIDLLEEAHYKGTDFVFVTLQNKTNLVIPMRLEEDLLNFDTYNLNNFWTVYHNIKQPQHNYNFQIELNFRDINISPEQVHEKEIIKEKRIKDGWKYLLDENGNEVKDSIGNKIKVDKFKIVRCKVYKFTQFKSTQTIGQVNYINLESNKLLESFPLATEFIFEHRYATYKGNKDALDKSHLKLLKRVYMPFPSNEQMIYDSAEDLKEKIKYIIKRNNFRK